MLDDAKTGRLSGLSFWARDSEALVTLSREDNSIRLTGKLVASHRGVNDLARSAFGIRFSFRTVAHPDSLCKPSWHIFLDSDLTNETKCV